VYEQQGNEDEYGSSKGEEPPLPNSDRLSGAIDDSVVVCWDGAKRFIFKLKFFFTRRKKSSLALFLLCFSRKLSYS